MADETITRDELAAWFRRFHYGDDEGENPRKVGERAADNAFADILSRREPAYEPGAVYQDQTGSYWLRTSDAMWQFFNKEGEFSDGYPRRPLRKLIPVPSRDAVRAALEGGLYSAMPYSVDGLTDRICKLLEAPVDGHG